MVHHTDRIATSVTRHSDEIYDYLENSRFEICAEQKSRIGDPGVSSKECFDLLNKDWKLIENNITNNVPIGSFIIMYKSVPQSGNHAPRNLRMIRLELV